MTMSKINYSGILYGLKMARLVLPKLYLYCRC